MAQKTNINININVANHVVRVAGGKPLTPSATDQDVEHTLKQALLAAWPSVHPNQILPTGNISFGYFGPFDHAQAGTPPPSAVAQITQDCENWQVPTDTGAPEQIVNTITTNLVATGGQAGQFAGTTPSGPNVDIDWLCYAGLGNATDVVYVFAAMANVNIG